MKQLFTSKVIFFLITTAVILSLNLIPLIMQFRHSPPGRTFALIHNNTQDFFFYQSLMNEGANGAWLTSDPYTAEPHQSSIIFSYFVWLGKLSKLLGLPFAFTYHLIRIILSIFFLFSIFYFLFSIRLPYPRLTYLFFLFAAPFMHKTADGSVVPYMNWWTGMDPIRRVAYLPHHIAGGLLLVITIIIFIKFYHQNLRSLLLAILLIPLLAFIHTPSLLILLLILPATLIFYYLLNKHPKIPILKTELNATNDRISLRHDTSRDAFTKVKGEQRDQNELGVSEKFGIEGASVGLIIYWIIGLFFLAVMISQTKAGFPWSQYIDWEKNLQFPLSRELIGALGILFPFSILGAWQAVRSKKFEYILITCWLFVPFLFIPIAPKIGLSNIRLIQGVPYLPLAILSIFGISSLENIFIQLKSLLIKSKIKNQKSKIQLKIQNLINTLVLKTGDAREGLPARAAAKTLSEHEMGVPSGRTRKLILSGILIIFFIFTYPTFNWSLQDQIREYWPIFGNVYLDNRLNNAFAFVNQNFPPKTVTLSTFYTGNYLPAFTRTVSFIGHFGYTYNLEEKQKNVMKFFEGKMTDEEAKGFLVSNKIALIWQGPEEKPIYKDYLYPKILKPVYDKEEATIYTVEF